MRSFGLKRSGGILTSLVLVTVLAFSAGTAVGQTADPKGSDTFDDVPVGHWADEEIGWAVANGITVGVGGGRFDLNGIVNRAQIFTLLYRTVNLLQDTPVSVLGSQLFDDVPAGKEDVVAAANGLEDGGTMYLHRPSRQDRQESLGTMGEEAPQTHNCKISGRGSVATGNK